MPFPALGSLRRDLLATGIGALVLASSLLLVGCGDEEPPAAPPGGADAPRRPGARDASGPEPIPLVDRAVFAFERLATGPLPPRAGPPLRLRDHGDTVERAMADLLAMPEATVIVLSREEVRRRATRVPNQVLWDNVLGVLQSLRHVPPELVRQWVEPVLDVEPPNVPLARSALRALVATQDAGLAPLVLRFLERFASDRLIGTAAFAALVQAGPPWRQQAMELALREGSPALWETLGGIVAGALPPEGRPEPHRPHSATDALAWWALLSEVAWPAPVALGTRTQAPAWYGARTLAAPEAWPREGRARLLAHDRERLLAPATLLDAGETVPTPLGACAALPASHVRLTGKGPAAWARCALGGRGHVPARLSVIRDLEIHAPGPDGAGGDAMLYATALHCVAVRDRPIDVGSLRAHLEEATRVLEGGGTIPPAAVGAVAGELGALGSVEPEEAQALAWRWFTSARPMRDHGPLLEAAYDLLIARHEAVVVERVGRMLLARDPDESAAAERLVRRDPRGAYAPHLDAAMERADAGAQAGLRRLAIWLHVRSPDIDPAARVAFVRRLQGWLDAAADAEAGTLSTALLDLGEPGAAAFAHGLRGPRRSVYLGALASRKERIPLEVAEAMLAPLDGGTPVAERHLVLVVGRQVFPAEAAPLLEAARARLPEALRPEADTVLEVVRHRAPSR